MQVQTFLTKIEYHKKPAFYVKFDCVPGLSASHIKGYLVKNRDVGVMRKKGYPQFSEFL